MVTDSISLLPSGTPTAMAFDEKNNLVFAGCRKGAKLIVIDTKSKKILSTLPICKGVDAMVFDEETKLIFCSGDGSTTVIKQLSANKYEVVQTITTKPRARTMAIDKLTHKIYVSSVDYEPNSRKIVPNSFALLVYKMN